MRYLIGILLAPLALLSIEASAFWVPQDNGFEEKVTLEKLKSASTKMLFWTHAERAIAFKNIEKIRPTRKISKSPTAKPFRQTSSELDSLKYQVDSQKYSLQDFISRPEAIGLVVLKGGDLVYENYTDGHDKNTRWISFSVTKAITSLLVGAAIKDGFIQGKQDKVSDYIPMLKGSNYDDVSIEHLLTMSSGIAWSEDYDDPNSDVAKAGALNGIELLNYLKELPRAHTPGTTFNYNTAESNLIGQILRSAIGNNASNYLYRKVWSKYGMTSDAYWLLGKENGAELGGCCLITTLRDLARLGQFALEHYQLKESSILAEGWVEASFTPSEANSNYGYQWFVLNEGRHIAVPGIFGQGIIIYPELDLVIAEHGNTQSPSPSRDYLKHLESVEEAIKEHYLKMSEAN